LLECLLKQVDVHALILQTMRLGKHLAHAGVASRRAAEALIFEGRVRVGGEVVRDPARDVGEADAITVDGREVKGFEPLVVYALNKPLGVLSTAKDPHGRPTVVGLLADVRARLYPVGRLDLDSEGLILLTNDGQLAHALTHPRFEVAKTYRVTVSGAPVGEAALRQLREGVRLQDGLTAPAEVRRVRKVSESSAAARRRSGSEGRRDAGSEQLLITIHEGRNRQVRRMCEAVGHPVQSLTRVCFGPLELGEMPAGSYRLLSDDEVQALRDATTMPRVSSRAL
jgi:23S rRNA pseudouridine2605 synthase